MKNRTAYVKSKRFADNKGAYYIKGAQTIYFNRPKA